MTGHWKRLMRIIGRCDDGEEHDWRPPPNSVAGSGGTEYTCSKCDKSEFVGIDPGVYS